MNQSMNQNAQHRRLLLLLLLSLLAMAGLPGGLTVNVMVGTDPTFYMGSSQYLSVSNRYYLVMQPDCDLVLYNQSGQAVLHTNSSRLSTGENPFNCSLWMQSDGNLVIYYFNSTTWGDLTAKYAAWAQNNYGYTPGPDGNRSFLLLGGDGSLKFYTTNSTLRANSSTLDSANVSTGVLNYPNFDPSNSTYTAWAPDASLTDFPYMPVGYFLSAGQRLQTLSSPGYTLELNASDCNLQSKQLLYAGGAEDLWQSGHTASVKNSLCRLELLQNGTLQVRDLSSSQVYWRSNTSGDSTVNWILKLDPDNGTLSVSDITNSSNLLWTNVSVLLPPSPGRRYTGIVVGVIVGAIAVALAALGLYFYAREKFLDPADKAFQKRLRASGGHVQALSQAKIKQATKNYKTVIGSGGFGDVFYGQLPDGQEVAAKVLSMTSRQSKQEFYNEIEVLSKVHHKYLVSLLGYSSTHTHQVLIYEYMGGGDLRRRLRAGESDPLRWRERTSIMLQVAEGLEYLHDKCFPPIIHRDIKSANILLTGKLVAKVADFGLSKLKAIGQEDATHVTTIVKGTPGYLDPEYHETGQLTEKGDVYAFGVVMMEILTGQQHMYIAHRVREAWRQQQCDGLADPQLGDDFDRNELVSLVELALWCVRMSSQERPFMRQVVRRLHELLLLPSETSQPSIELGEEGQYPPLDIELVRMMKVSSGNLSSETMPLSSSGSSSTGVSFEVRHHSGQARSRSWHGRD